MDQRLCPPREDPHRGRHRPAQTIRHRGSVQARFAAITRSLPKTRMMNAMCATLKSNGTNLDIQVFNEIDLDNL